jgi:hypothetical protein
LKSQFFFRLLIVLLLLMSGSAVFGKTPPKFGIKAGVGVSNLEIDPKLTDIDSRIGATGGIFMVIGMSEVWAIQTELLYVPKGATDKQQGTDENGQPIGEFTTTFQINYLEIPILARFSLGSTPLFFVAGPALDFKLSSKISTSDSPYGDTDDDWKRITGMDFGLVFGGGVAFPVSFGELVFDVRYTAGLLDVYKDGNAKFRNSTLAMTAGVSF